jgi:exportin-2 (importin alpha re-exporter)
MSLLTRLQTNKTDKFANLFCFFVLYIFAIRVGGMTPDYVLGVMEGAQAGCVAFSLSNSPRGCARADCPACPYSYYLPF